MSEGFWNIRSVHGKKKDLFEKHVTFFVLNRHTSANAISNPLIRTRAS